MKIAYIFAYLGNGGAEDHAVLLAKQAKLAGNTPLFIIDGFSTTSRDRLEKLEIKVKHLSMNSSFNPIKVVKSLIGLCKIIKNEKIQIVHTHMLREHSLAVILKIFGLKFGLIRTFHRFDQFNGKMRLLLPVYRKYTDAFVGISNGMIEYLKSNGVSSKLHLIENGVEKIEASSHQKAIGFIGRLAEEKGILKFIESNLDLLRKHKMVIAGDGPDFNKIKKVVEKNNLQVKMLGRVSDKSEFYEKTSVLALPSRTEVLPLVILEAYSCGLPVVAFDIDSMRDLVNQENGELINFGDYKKMGETAEKLAFDGEKYKKKNIEKFEMNYSADIMWAKTLDLYNRLS